MSEHDDKLAHLNAVAAMLGITPEQMLKTQADALNRVEAEAEEAENTLPLPPIVYPNVKFKPYKFRPYPKAAYRGYVQDVEQAEQRVTRNADGTTTERMVIRVLPDQYVPEQRDLKNQIEEMALENENKKLPVGRKWLLKYTDAREAAFEAKKNQRPIVEREPTAAELKAAKAAAEEAGAQATVPARRGRPPKAAVAA